MSSRKEALLLLSFARGGDLFAVGTKSHDGVEYHKVLYDQLILAYFTAEIETTRSFLQILHLAEKTTVLSVLRLIADLVDRIMTSASGAALVLPAGGRSATKLNRSHVQSLVSLVSLIFTARCLKLHVAPTSVLVDDAHDAILIAICYYEACKLEPVS